jgi:hypothetical protein
MDAFGIGSIARLGSDIVNRIWPDATAAEQAKLALVMADLESQVKLAMSQAEINKTEAASGSLFVAGWRPGLGWICVVAMGYNFVMYPLLLWLTAWFPEINAPQPVVSEMLWELMFGMLGLASLRSWEKSKGIAR